MTLLIDNRLGSRDLIHYPPLSEIGELTLLPSADCAFVGNGEGDNPILIGVEVKKIGELVGSLETGRLQAEQIPKMTETYDVSWLLYYGAYRPNPEGNVEVRRGGKSWRELELGTRKVGYGYLESFLASPSFVSTGINVKHVYGIEEAALWLGVLYKTWRKKWGEHKSMKVFNRAGESTGARVSRISSPSPPLPPHIHQRAYTASSWPGVGYEKGVAAAEQIGTIREMVESGVERWSEVRVNGKRIGAKVAKGIVETFDK